MGYRATSLFKTIAAQGSFIAQGTTQALSNVVWAFAKVGVEEFAKLEGLGEALFKNVASQHSRIASQGTPQQLSNIVWGFATLKVRDAALFEAVATQGSRLAKEGKPQNIANTVWAYTMVGIQAKAMFRAMAAQSSRIAKEGIMRDIVHTMWSFALNDEATPLFDELRSIFTSNKKSAFEGEDIFQLYGVYLWLKPRAKFADLSFPAQWLKEAAACHGTGSWHGSQDRIPVSSNMHMDVCRHLTDLGYEYTNEVQVFDVGYLAVDIALTGRKLAIEFNGPHHYVVDVTTKVRTEDGKTKFKRRLLELYGWRVATVDSEYWRSMQNAGRRAHMLEKLKVLEM